MQDEPVISWKVAGAMIGLLLILATALVKPLGVSTQYVVTDGLILHSAAPALAESNEYLSKYGDKDEWGVGYGWMLVAGMFLGGGISAFITRRFRNRDKPSLQSSGLAISFSPRAVAIAGDSCVNDKVKSLHLIYKNANICQGYKKCRR